MQRFLLLLALLTVPLIAYFWYTNGQVPVLPSLLRPLPLVTFNDKTPLRVYVVRHEAERIRGLSGRTSLGPTEGMLFVFAENDYHGIWMKDMKFPIDIMWIDEKGTIIDAVESALPESFPRVFEPKIPARYVIETNANFMDSFNINVGDKVTLPLDSFGKN